MSCVKGVEWILRFQHVGEFACDPLREFRPPLVMERQSASLVIRIEARVLGNLSQYIPREHGFAYLQAIPAHLPESDQPCDLARDQDLYERAVNMTHYRQHPMSNLPGKSRTRGPCSQTSRGRRNSAPHERLDSSRLAKDALALSRCSAATVTMSSTTVRDRTHTHTRISFLSHRVSYECKQCRIRSPTR